MFVPLCQGLNKALARRIIEEAWNQGNMAAVDELMEMDTVAKISNYPEQGLTIHTIVRKQLWAVMIEGMPNQANQDNNRSFPNTVGRVFLPSVATAAPRLYQCMIQA